LRRRIFFGFSAGIGPFIRCVPLMEKLRLLGFEVSYNAIDNIRLKMNKMGFQLIDVPWVTGLDQSLLPSPKAKWFDAGEYWATIGYKDKKWIKKLWLTYTECVASFKPDLIVGDFSIESRIAAELLKVPYLSITQSCYHPNCKEGRLRWWEDVPKDKIDVKEEVNDVLQELNLNTINKLEELFTGDITVIPSFPEFDELVSTCNTTRFVGSILWDGELDNSHSFNFADNVSNNIFVYPGRMHDFVGESGLSLIKWVNEYLGNTRYDIYVSCGFMDKIESIADFPILRENIRLVKWIPVENAYKNSKMVIHHGGHGSCMASIVFGTPSLVIPTHTEREYNARSLQNLNCGRYVLPQFISKQSFFASFDEIMNEKTINQSLMYWQSEIKRRKYNSVEQMENMIVELLSKKSEV